MRKSNCLVFNDLMKGFQNHFIKHQFIRHNLLLFIMSHNLTGMAKIFILDGIILSFKLCKQIYLIKIFAAVKAYQQSYFTYL